MGDAADCAAALVAAVTLFLIAFRKSPGGDSIGSDGVGGALNGAAALMAAVTLLLISFLESQSGDV